MKTIAKIFSPGRLRDIVLRCSLFSCTCLLFSIAATLPAQTDPWLDRVEKKLRLLQSSSEHIERAQIGSSAAAKHHQDCVRAGLESSCDRIIWRDPDLGEIRDWAVGVAHIKRAEIRVERGDVVGAIQDYQDSLKYHQYPLVPERIEKLKSVLAKVEADKLAAASEAAKVATQRDSLLSDRQPPSQRAHPVVVLHGWSASLAALQVAPDPSQPEKEQTPAPVDLAEKQLSPAALEEPPSKNSSAGSNASAAQPPRIVTTALQTYAPGRHQAAIAATFGDEARADVRGDVASSSPLESISASQVPPGTEEGTDVTTGSLPMATQYQDSVGVYLLFTALLLAALTLTVWGMPSTQVFPRVFDKSRQQRPTNRKVALSRHDIETMVKRRNSAAAVHIQEATRAIVAIGEASASRTPAAKNRAVETPPSSKVRSAISPPKKKATKATPVLTTAPQRSASPKVPDQVPSTQQPSRRLPADVLSTVKRIPHGAASLIAVESGSNVIRQLFDAVTDEARETLRKRYVDLKTQDTPYASLLNIFTGSEGQSSIDWQRQQQLNAMIEMQAVCLTAVFGSPFMNANHVALRQILQLMRYVPDAGMGAFVDLLKAGNLKRYDEALSRLDNIAARMFFTTEFLSSDFSRQRAYMAEKLEQLLGHSTVRHLLEPPTTTNHILSTLNGGTLVCLDVQAMTDDVNQQRFLTLALLARLAMLQASAKTGASSEVAKAIIIDRSSAVFAQGQADAEFLSDEARKSGFSVTIAGARHFN